MPESAQQLADWAHRELRVQEQWTLITSRTKLAKTLFEVSDGKRHYVGKTSNTQGKAGTFGLMQRLWDAGMKPPSQFRIVEPVAWFPEKLLLIQEKAPGEALMESVKRRDSRAMEAMELAGGWLQHMQTLQLDLPAAPDLTDVVDRCSRELEIPEATKLLDQVKRDLHVDSRQVPSHGDFHPLNVYVTPEGTVTAIDLDTLAMREPAFDVAWFLAQLAIMGHHALGSFAATRELRQRFRLCAPSVPDERVDLHIRFALLRSLHYDFCILKVKDHAHRDDFLRAAERGLDL